MTADEKLKRIRIKTKRAEEHLRSMETEIRAFINSFVIRSERDPETREPVCYLESVKPFPDVLSQLVADILFNLRSALDHLAYQLVFVGTDGLGITSNNKRNPFSHVYFPIYNSASDYKSYRHKKVKGMTKTAIKAIDALKPYKGGNDLFWQLNELNNIEKHRFGLGLTMNPYMNFSDIMPRWQDEFPEFKQGGPGHPGLPVEQILIRFRSITHEERYEFWRGRPDAEVQDQFPFTFKIAFAEPEFVKGKPIHETLRDMSTFIDCQIASFKPLLA